MRASLLLAACAAVLVATCSVSGVSASTPLVLLSTFDHPYCAMQGQVATSLPMTIGECVPGRFIAEGVPQQSMLLVKAIPHDNDWLIQLFADTNCTGTPNPVWGTNTECWVDKLNPEQSFTIVVTQPNNTKQARSVATIPRRLSIEEVSAEEIANMTSSELSMLSYTPAQIKFWSDFACTGDIGTMTMPLKQGTCLGSGLSGYAFLTSRWQATTGAWEIDFYKIEKFCGGRPDKIVTGTGPQCQFIKSSTTPYNSWTVQIPRGYRLKATTRMIEEEKVEVEEVEVEEPIFVTAGPKGDTCTNGCFVTARACQDACHIDSQCIQRCTDTYSMCMKACGSFKNKLVEV